MIVGLIAAGSWISLLIIAVALCRVAGHADDAMASPFLELTPACTGHPAAAASRESGARVALFPR